MLPSEPSEKIRERVIAARKLQEERFKPFKGIHCNAMMTERMLHEFAEPNAASLDMLRMAMEKALDSFLCRVKIPQGGKMIVFHFCFYGGNKLFLC